MRIIGRCHRTIRPTRRRPDFNLVFSKVRHRQAECHRLLYVRQQQVVYEKQELIRSIAELARPVPSCEAVC